MILRYLQLRERGDSPPADMRDALHKIFTLSLEQALTPRGADSRFFTSYSRYCYCHFCQIRRFDIFLQFGGNFLVCPSCYTAFLNIDSELGENLLIHALCRATDHPEHWGFRNYPDVTEGWDMMIDDALITPPYQPNRIISETRRNNIKNELVHLFMHRYRRK